MKKYLVRLLWSIILISVSFEYITSILPIDSFRFKTSVFYSLILAPAIVIVYAIFSKTRVYLVIPSTILAYVLLTIGSGLYYYIEWKNNMSPSSLWDSIIYTFPLSGDGGLAVLMNTIIPFFLYLTLFTISYYVFDLRSTVNKINFANLKK